MTRFSGALSPDELPNVAGPLIIGCLLNWGLYGALSVQIYMYHLAFPKDRPTLQLLVYGIFSVETLQAILVVHDLYASFVNGFGDFDELTKIRTAWLTMPILSGIVAFCVQVFYAFRITILSGSRLLGSSIVLMAFLLLAGALIAGIEAKKAGDIIKLASKLEYIGNGLLDITSGVCDVVIAISMTFYLSRMSSGGLKSTHAIVNRILRLVMGTGSLTAATTIINVSLFYFGAGKYTAWFITPSLTLGRLYSNSMMVILNSRMDITGGRGQHTDIEFVGSDPALAAPSTKPEPGDMSFRRNSQNINNAIPQNRAVISNPSPLQERSTIF